MDPAPLEELEGHGSFIEFHLHWGRWDSFFANKKIP